MTHMLASLAGGKLVVALEVCPELRFLGALLTILFIPSQGWLQPRLYIKFCAGGRSRFAWGCSTRIASNDGL